MGNVSLRCLNGKCEFKGESIMKKKVILALFMSAMIGCATQSELSNTESVTQPDIKNTKDVTQLGVKATRTSNGVYSEMVMTSTKQYQQHSGTRIQTETEVAALKLERQKENEKRIAQLKSYKSEELTHDQFVEDGWNCNECKYGRIGIIVADPQWVNRDYTYVIGYFDIPVTATYEEDLDEDKERMSMQQMGGKYIQNIVGAPIIIICELVFYKDTLKSIKWTD